MTELQATEPTIPTAAEPEAHRQESEDQVSMAGTEGQEEPQYERKIEIMVTKEGNLTLGLSKQNFKNHEFYGMMIATLIELIVSNLKNELLNAFAQMTKTGDNKTAQIEALKKQMQDLLKQV